MPLTSPAVSRMCFPPDTSSTLLRNLRNPDFSFYREETALERARALLPGLRRQRPENPGQLEMGSPQQVCLTLGEGPRLRTPLPRATLRTSF